MQLANRPGSKFPSGAYAEADTAGQISQRRPLGSTGFNPSVLTASFPGMNATPDLGRVARCHALVSTIAHAGDAGDSTQLELPSCS
jgi:hypothetical protein